MNIFMIYIGGKNEKALIELHDMCFVVAETIEDTYDELRKYWWGDPKTLHIDCYGKLTSADGHNIHLKTETANSENKLYFVNLGGYSAQEFTELHKNVLVVANNESEAKIRAVQQITDWQSPHRDYLFEVENIFCLDKTCKNKNLYIHLEQTDNPEPFAFTCKYMPLGKNT